MAGTIVISCPECDKQLKAPAELEGKKIRCKGCGHSFVIQRPSAGKAAAVQPKAAPATPVQPKVPAKKGADDDDEEDNDPNPYRVTEINLTPRCPFCAAEMEEGAIICLDCGYNTQTREHARTVKAHETTGMDYFLWLLPGLLCVLLVIFLIVFNLFYFFVLPGLLDEGWLRDLFTFGGLRLWAALVPSLFGAFFATRFAIKRLIFNPTPPEKIKER